MRRENTSVRLESVFGKPSKPRHYLQALVRVLFATALAIGLLCQPVPAQNFINYTTSIGNTPFSTTMPVPMGFVDLSNGNLHMTVPLGSWPQRGNHPFTVALEYDSRIWVPAIVGSTLTWQPTNVPNSQGGWRFVTTPVTGGTTSFQYNVYNCNGTLAHPPYPRNSVVKYFNFQWTDPYGTVRLFPIHTVLDTTHCFGDVASDTEYATDSSGFQMKVSNHSTGIKILAPDGSQVYPTFEDTNGNTFGKDSNGNVIDTLGRTPVVVTTNCGGNSNQTCYDVLNSQGTTSRYTVTTQSISVSTSFGELPPSSAHRIIRHPSLLNS
jgi:hypothetical protein